MRKHKSFCESVYAAKTYREVPFDSPNPQLFLKLPPIWPNYTEAPPELLIKTSAVDSTTYCFPWKQLGLPIDDAYLRFWFDEESGELRIAFLRRP